MGLWRARTYIDVSVTLLKGKKESEKRKWISLSGIHATRGYVVIETAILCPADQYGKQTVPYEIGLAWLMGLVTLICFLMHETFCRTHNGGYAMNDPNFV